MNPSCLKTIKWSVDKAFNFFQGKVRRCYFAALYNINSKLCIPLGIFFQNLPKCHFFREISGIGKNRESFQLFKFSTYRLVVLKYSSCQNFVEKYLFLTNFSHFPFLPIYQDIDQDLQKWKWEPFEKIWIFDVMELEPSNLVILCLLWCTWKSQRIEALEKNFGF